MADDTKHIFASLAVNVTIAVAKAIGAALTGSGALLAEAIHSAADCTNQLLLLVGVRGSAKPPNATHPLGPGRSMYFWSFVVALLLFSGGGVFSIYEGLHKLQHPEPLENPLVGLGILVFSLLLEGWATWGNLKELKVRRGATPLLRHLRETKDSDLVVVFGENSAAVLGLSCALLAMGLAWWTGNGTYDALGSLAVGGVLVAVALFLGVEVQSLLLGERADPVVEGAVRTAQAEVPQLDALLTVLTLQQGPKQVMVAAKVRIKPGLSAAEAIAGINHFERRIKELAPDVRWCFIEPDDKV